MYQIFLDWLQIPADLISEDLIFIFAGAGALLVLSFIFDFFRYILYYISRSE